MTWRLLDLFCGAGGAGMGYHRSGFDVVGVDVVNQPSYPFTFHRADAMTYPLDGFDVIHGSPPCQRYSRTRSFNAAAGTYPDLVGPLLDRLTAAGVPWIIENVVGAPLPNAAVVCGAALGLVAADVDGTPLVLVRHRLFASSVLLMVPPCACATYRRGGRLPAGVYGHGPSKPGTRSARGYVPTVEVRRRLTGIDWMRREELSEAIPPAYTQLIGAQLVDYLAAVR